MRVDGAQTSQTGVSISSRFGTGLRHATPATVETIQKTTGASNNAPSHAPQYPTKTTARARPTVIAAIR